MGQVHIIRHKVHVEGLSEHEVARQLGLSRNTVAKYHHVTEPRAAVGTRAVRYRYYLPKLACKPRAVRQVAPELVAELSEPYGRLWCLLEETHGGLEAARVLARLLAVIDREGEEVVSSALDRALRHSPRFQHRAPATSAAQARRAAAVTVPEALRCYEVEAGRAADYDWLLGGGCAMTEASHAAREAVLGEHLKTLRLPTVAREYLAAARRARDAGGDYEEFLRELLEAEVRIRQEHSAARLLKRTAFPDVKTLDQLNWAALEGVARPKIMCKSLNLT